MSTITINGPGLQLTFSYLDARLSLTGMQRDDAEPMLFPDEGAVGNPLALVVRAGEQQGIYGMETFRVTELQHSERRLLAYLAHETLPLLLAIEVEVEGHVATWRGQACWNGDAALDADIYFPLLSRVRFAGADVDRALLPQISGAVYDPLGEVNFRYSYLGNLSCPLFLVEGGGRGLAVLDDNQADFAADPSAGLQRSYAIGNHFPLPDLVPKFWEKEFVEGGENGPFLAVCHTRRFNPVGEFDVNFRHLKDERTPPPLRCLGDAADLGPVRTYAYAGPWQVGTEWLRERRQHTPFRVSPAAWYRQTTFLAEHMGDDMVQQGQSFYDYPLVMADKERLGADLFHIPGFHDPDLLGTGRNWLNRGDYFFAAQNLGGFEAVRQGVETVHRRGGRILYYVEGLIMWKKSRIGRYRGKEWALMEEGGGYTEHYKGFWHMCPAYAGWRTWIAETCADIVRTTGIDGFFIDSTTATFYHRCFNPEHRHPHPDVWNWGVRQMLRDIRAAVDQVNPETVLLVEGCGDIAREFADGFVSHGHAWTGNRLSEPLVRFLHPDMRAFESWGDAGMSEQYPGCTMQQIHVWNSVNGYRIYAHNPNRDEMAAMSLRTRRYYDAYPEICDNPLGSADLVVDGGIARLFTGAPCVVTVGNVTDEPASLTLTLPLPCGVLFDRVDGMRVPVSGRQAKIALAPWEFRAYEVRV